MHRFLQNLDGATIRRAEHELTILTEERVAKVVPCEPGAALRAVDVDGVSPWLEFHWLDPEETTALELDERTWLLALRDFTPGVPLSRREFDDSDALDLALRLAYRVRDLHEIGVPHGDLQPGNVVVDHRDVWLIDLAPVESQPGDRGHVAGSAPLMAPELWEGAPPSPPGDVYALGCLVYWMLTGDFPHRADNLTGWATAHRASKPRLDGVSTTLSGAIRRCMNRSSPDRPPPQVLIDALVAEGAQAPLPPTLAGGLQTVDVDEIVRQLDRTHLQLDGPPLSGKTFALRQLAAHLATHQLVTIRMAGDRAFGRPADPDGGAWGAVRSLMDALASYTGDEFEFPELRGGDRLWVFERLTTAVLDLVGTRPVVILWDDFDDVRPDTKAWWDHFVDAATRRGAPVSTIVVRGEVTNTARIVVEPAPIEPKIWNRWRASTLRTEVRDTSQARWDQLVTEHGDRVGALLRALDSELGTRATTPRTRRRELDSETLTSMRAGWHGRVAELSAQCAFGEVVEICETLYRNLQARKRADPETSQNLLSAWTEAAIGGGGHHLNDALRTALRERDEVWAVVLFARLCNALGEHAEGLDALRRVESEQSAVAAEIHSWRAQLALSSGRFDEAREEAMAGLALEPLSPPIDAHLRVLLHAPLALRGDAEAIVALEELAPRLEKVGVNALLRARLHAYRALGLTRTDQLDEATDAHLRALEQIELGGLSAELPTYLLNVGTAYHRQGRLGLAREYYARGVRVAQPTTRASTRALLYANQANVDLALGRLGEARDLVARGLEIARAEELTTIEVMCRSVTGDIALSSGDHDRARELYLAILDQREELELSPHQATEVELALAETALRAGDPAEAANRLDAARHAIEAEKLSDLEHHHGILRARLQWAEGGSLGTMAGIELFRRNLLGTEQSGNHRLVLRQAPYLVAELRREGLDELLDEVAGVVQRSRNAIAMGLGRDLRRDFFANLPSLDTSDDSPVEHRRESPRPTPAPPPRADGVEPFYRMLSLNEVILHADRLHEMLPDALDIAMSLSHAERGFILLRDEAASRVGTFRVAASRDIDGDPIPSPHLEVSLTIAEEAARTGRTVVTLDARDDNRFSEALSVVDLDLTSVLCVPVRDGSGLLGALYVDHRFRPGVFEGEIPRMMEAFGHQLALAITNARRVEELEAAREQLSELLEEREAMLVGLERRVSELTDQVERHQVDGTLRDAFPDIAYGSSVMEKVLSQVQRVSRGDIPVVVTGESGVGKELIARAIHDASPRRNEPFIAFNCGAVSESLFESEMFGHVKGAFTGADIDRRGLFHAADGGTIFLDEIGEMPPQMQVKLLRVLQEGQVRRVGESKSTPIDVRIVAATNRNLAEMVDSGDFREDLYYRLAAFVIEVPALRDRREDIPLIAAKILEGIAARADRDVRLTPPGARLLSQCQWPGNVRELENTLRAAAVMADRDELGEEELAPLVRLRTESGTTRSASRVETRGRRCKANRHDVVEALRRANDDREEAAQILGVSERTLYRYLKRWDLY